MRRKSFLSVPFLSLNSSTTFHLYVKEFHHSSNGIQFYNELSTKTRRFRPVTPDIKPSISRNESLSLQDSIKNRACKHLEIRSCSPPTTHHVVIYVNMNISVAYMILRLKACSCVRDLEEWLLSLRDLAIYHCECLPSSGRLRLACCYITKVQ